MKGRQEEDVILEPIHDGDDDDEEDATTIEEEERDEIKEIQEFSRIDTWRVRAWRLAVTAMLLTTALVVTLTTYYFLKKEQDQNFYTAFEQFSRTIRDAALEEQRSIIQGYAGFARTLSASAQMTNASSSWPLYNQPLFETFGRTYRGLTRAEILVHFNVVRRNERAAYHDWAAQHYHSAVQEGHITKSGEPLEMDPALYYPDIFGFGAEGQRVVTDDDVAVALWGFSPPPFTYKLINWNSLSIPDYLAAFTAASILQNETVITRVRPFAVSIGNGITAQEHEAMHAKLPSDSKVEHPHSMFIIPIHRDANDYNSDIVGVVGGGNAWDAALIDLLPDEVHLHAVLRNTCNQSYTYEVDGPIANFRGEGDLHEPQFSEMERSVDLAVYTHPDFRSTPGHCQFSMHVYPTTRFHDTYDQNTPEIFCIVVAMTFVLVTVVFFTYDMFVQKRNQKLVINAARSNAVLADLFPTNNLRNRLVGARATQQGKADNLKSFISSGANVERNSLLEGKPMADLFLETTVLFADITGFTAWSSVREPTQVFTLLEIIYASFDVTAKRRRVCKVETVGDCYVAVTGLPHYQEDHAVTMARFANELIHKMTTLAARLETTLGPDTGDLGIRIGMHSGPVTAGVLRGARSRFQLFGDTVNTASRMESMGQRGRIHITKETALLIKDAGKGSWLEAREDQIEAKGKGALFTYWLNVVSRPGSVESGTAWESDSLSDQELEDEISKEEGGIDGLDDKTARLVDWNVVQLLRLIKQIVARRRAKGSSPFASSFVSNSSQRAAVVLNEESVLGSTAESQPLHEVREIITLPEFDRRAARRQEDPDRVELPTAVEDELRDYVTAIAKLYRNNAFHSFDHCSHVAMSVLKLMSRIVAPTEVLEHVDDDAVDDRPVSSKSSKHKRALSLHDHTYGITSDPLTQFACVFSAIIHDADHTGVPNTQLIKENEHLASMYGNRSVAEQNSLDLAWGLLMQQRYTTLRSMLYSNEAELIRFRQLVVNSVMATDICDKELKNLRNERWDKAFSNKRQDSSSITTSDDNLNCSTTGGGLDLSASSAHSGAFSAPTSARDAVNRKATIVIEHLIQASDVSHTMQHWHVYRKWNERFFFECYKAYLSGRADSDPSTNWYEGEMGFFDFYIIPLAKKLKDCGVFGKSSDEYLNYAMNNRQEWENKGEAVVAEMLEKYHNRQARRSMMQMTRTASEVGGLMSKSVAATEESAS